MTRRMLIDASHKEECRVSIINERRLEAFDYESNSKSQLKGNIYLAKVTRVEPSLQACFVEYGGNRQGFLAFSEIHPDYYQIPAADREALMQEVQARLEADAAEEDEADAAADDADENEKDIVKTVKQAELLVPSDAVVSEVIEVPDEDEEDDTQEDNAEAVEETEGEADDKGQNHRDDAERRERPLSKSESADAPESEHESESVDAPEKSQGREKSYRGNGRGRNRFRDRRSNGGRRNNAGRSGGSRSSSDRGRNHDDRRNLYRGYKIQEVIKKRQILLIQVVKEERGAKGAALTTYLSLAGRYCVLMPNTTRGGGVSRKIGNVDDRKRLKSILSELEVPKQMAVILRTAGAERSRVEIKRDYEYLSKLWNDIREKTMQSVAPALINEEGNIVKRAIRDLYTRDVDEVLVAGEQAYRTAKDFMKTLIPSHARKVKFYKDDEALPLFHKYNVERQLANIYEPRIELRSGGSIVLHQTEALVSIDVNSGKATRERHIEETALKTNLEAAEEIARQLSLRDLAGLVVIDFIDMDDRRNDMAVERRFKESLKHDRARIQVGRISEFGLLEMSRQRLRPSLQEATSQPCDHCGGTGYVIADESAALNALRSIEEEAIKRKYQSIQLRTAANVALFLLNHKRTRLNEIEEKYKMKAIILPDASLIAPAYEIDHRIPYDTDHANELVDVAPVEREAQDSDENNDEDSKETRENNKKRKRGRRGGRTRKRDEEQNIDETKSVDDAKQDDKAQVERPSGPPVMPKIVNYTPKQEDASNVENTEIESETDINTENEPVVNAIVANEVVETKMLAPGVAAEMDESPKKTVRKPRVSKSKATKAADAKATEDAPKKRRVRKAKVESVDHPEKTEDKIDHAENTDNTEITPAIDQQNENDAADGPRRKGWWHRILE